jgi:hypothetical protein
MSRPPLLLLLALVLVPLPGRAQTILSDFSLNADGWHAYAGADPTTTVVYSASGGTGGGGAIILQEPANGANDYFEAPVKFTGNLGAYYNGTLGFDLKLSPAWDNSSEAAMVILTGVSQGQTLSIGYLPPSGLYPNANGFTTFTLALDATTAWSITNGSDFVTGTLATPTQIKDVLSNLSNLRILGDWTNSLDRDLLDNVRLTGAASVPEPSSVALLALAGALACFVAAWREYRKMRAR